MFGGHGFYKHLMCVNKSKTAVANEEQKNISYLMLYSLCFVCIEF